MSALIRVVLADDHPVVRRGLAAMIDVEDDIEVVGEAENGEQAVALTLSLKPDVVLMDLKMPILDGVEAIRRIRAEVPVTRVIILSTFADDDDIYAGIAAGARGYLLKDAPPEQLIQFIRAAYRGESLLHPGVAARILDRFSSMMTQPPPAALQRSTT
jgi:DNA-binding NarL/FixJ family response regulator